MDLNIEQHKCTEEKAREISGSDNPETMYVFYEHDLLALLKGVAKKFYEKGANDYTGGDGALFVYDNFKMHWQQLTKEIK